jgi:ATP-dependent Lon protease
MPSAENFYRIGVLLQVTAFQPADQGYILQVQSSHKVVVNALNVEDGVAVAECSRAEEITDLDENSQAEMLVFIKETVSDLSRHFQGSGPFVEAMLGLNSAEKIMGYILPYMAVTVAEKQELLEAMSLREKCIRFIDLLIKQKESLHLQIEMARKISSSNNKNYRKTLLREQLKAIQDELHEEDEVEEDGYKQKN